MRYDADLVIASDGLNSRVRTRYAETYKPDIDTRECRFVWLGTEQTFDAFNFAFVQTEHGWFQAHAYQLEPGMLTVIVETRDEDLKEAGPEDMLKEHGGAHFVTWYEIARGNLWTA